MIKSWSISRFNTYQQCPLKFKYSYVDKISGPAPKKSEAMERGNDIHKLAERYLKNELPRLPTELKLAGPEFKRLRMLRIRYPQRVIVEETSARRADWTPTVYNDWNNCWVRIKLDVAYIEEVDGRPVGSLVDWKTGKHRPDDLEQYTQQLDLYALDALMRWEALIPAGLTIRPRLVYLDTPVVVEPRVYTGADLKPLKKAWEARVKPMFKDRKFAPRPNRFCPWCEFSTKNGGPCNYGS